MPHNTMLAMHVKCKMCKIESGESQGTGMRLSAASVPATRPGGRIPRDDGGLETASPPPRLRGLRLRQRKDSPGM